MGENSTKTPFVLLITGKPNSGKSTLAYELVQKHLRNVLIIDGDKHREQQFLGRKMGFTRDEIMQNNEHVIKLAQFCQEQGFNVIIAQICPFKEQRWEMRKRLQNFHEVLLHCRTDVRRSRPNYIESNLEYEYDRADLALLSDDMSIRDCVSSVLKLVEKGAFERRRGRRYES